MSITDLIRYVVMDNGWSRWYVMRPWRDRQERRAIERRIGDYGEGEEETGVVCCLFDGCNEAGGLADRLRGMVAVYQECKRRGLPFRLWFKHPFDLELFLEPAAYDWRITRQRICGEEKKTQVIVMRPLSDSPFTLRKQQAWMQRTFDRLAGHTFHQAHIYTNASTAYGEQYAGLFAELFRPTPRLRQALEAIRQEIGGKYISVSMRFLQLLGDFKDVVDVGATLTASEQEALMAECIRRIEQLHEQYPDHRILVNSDSQRMLAEARRLPYVYAIEGEIIHFDRCEDRGDEYAKFEKTFLDFLTIANAERVFLIKCHSHMRYSGFPYAAAMIGGKEYEIIE